jgi:peptide methionine sulfoxide reductase msrA/msrB
VKKEKIILAGGCFWGMEQILKKIPGVLNTEVGYCGGIAENPTYSQVCTGQTGHAESVLVEFDSEKISLSEILKNYFFKMHDPTTLNRQGHDVGSQYRSAIFCYDESQMSVAQIIKEEKDGLRAFRFFL